MKINEVIAEQGLLSRLGQGVKGAVSSYKSGKLTASDPVLKQAVDRWAKVSQQLSLAGVDMKNRHNYAKALNQWLSDQLRLDNSQSEMLTDFSSHGVTKFIQAALAKNATRRITSSQPATAQPSTAAAGLPPNVKILATNPIVMQVDKQRFELDNQNKWHYLGTSKPLTPGQQAVLNQYLQMI